MRAVRGHRDRALEMPTTSTFRRAFTEPTIAHASTHDLPSLSPFRDRSPSPSFFRVRSPSANIVSVSAGLRSTPAVHLPLSPSPAPKRSTDSLGPGSSSHANTPTAVRSLSTASLTSVTPTALELRDVLRAAMSVLVREMLHPAQMPQSIGAREAEEIELRLRIFARIERIWIDSPGASNTASQLGYMPFPSTVREDRERRLFAAVLRDGYVLCQSVSFQS
jgi:hypothetical protein